MHEVLTSEWASGIYPRRIGDLQKMLCKEPQAKKGMYSMRESQESGLKNKPPRGTCKGAEAPPPTSEEIEG